MKNITAEFKNTLQNETLNLVRCWKFTLKNEEILAFTTASEKFLINGVEYNPISANDIENITMNSEVKSDAFRASNIISSDIISAKDILSGKYDGAKIEVFITDLSNLDAGKVMLTYGRISDIEYEDNLFIAKVKGLKDEINKVIGDVYTPLCRASFCDKKCKLNILNYTFYGSIDNIVDETNFSTNSNEIISKSRGYFDNGTIEFTNGDNIGQKTEVKQFAGDTIMLAIEMPYKLKIGDEFKIITGCDKQFKTCCEKFNNAINFRGEPHLPGTELLFKVM